MDLPDIPKDLNREFWSPEAQKLFKSNSPFSPAILEAARILCRELGPTDAGLGRALGVTPGTIRKWKEVPEFIEMVEMGRLEADRKVVQALYKRAVGYEIKERKVVRKGRRKIQRVETVVKEVVPDVKAAEFWLKNRRPDEWCDRREIEHSGAGGLGNGAALINLTLNMPGVGKDKDGKTIDITPKLITPAKQLELDKKQIELDKKQRELDKGEQEQNKKSVESQPQPAVKQRGGREVVLKNE